MQKRLDGNEMERLLFLLVLLLSGAAGNQSEKQDIIFLVDTSWRMPRVMTEVRISLMRLISSLRPRCGLIQYDQELKTMWHLNTSMGLSSQLNAVRRIRPMRPGPPRLGAALMHVLRSEFKPTAGARPDAKKRAFALTSGHSEDDIEFPLQHLRDSDIDVLLIDVSTGQDHLSLANATGFSSAESRRNMETETCSRCFESVRLVAGSSLCSGRLEVKNQSEQTWSSVCEAAFDQQDAEVVCRQLGCGPPSGLQGELSVGVETPMWSREFQCGGQESALRDCRSSTGGSCSAGRAAGLTCSEPVRLVGGPSRCDGTLQLKQGAWRPVTGTDWTQAEMAAACRQLDCGSAVSGSGKPGPDRPAWGLRAGCAGSGSSLRECASPSRSSSTVILVCSDLLVEPFIWVSSESGVYWPPQQGAAAVLQGSSFSISCSIQPQYPGGSFHLSFTSPSATRLLSQPAANHSAHFLFAAAEPEHQGSYRCAYWLHMFSRNFSSQSPQMSLSVSDPTAFGIRLLFLLVFLSAVCTIYKVLRRHSSAPQQDIRMDLSNQGSRTGAAEPREQNRGSRTREAEPEPQNWHSRIEAAKQGSRTRTAGARKQNQGSRTGEAELEQQNWGSRTGEAEPEQASAWL